jgi:membrane-bound serine protease (ClpP class)
MMLRLILTALLGLNTAEPPTTIPPARKAAMVAVIPIRGPIDAITKASVEQRLAMASELGADAVVIELDTPGGELLATLEITHLIRTQAPANTVAWVNPFAFSAGTIIALSARQIVTAPDAMMGDAAPVTSLGPIPATERAKIESPLLAEVIDEARRHHYDERLVQAFVSVGIELWLLRDSGTGEVVFVDRDEYTTIFGVGPIESLTSITPPQGDQPFQVSPLLTMLAGLQPEDEAIENDIAAEPLLPTIRSPLSSRDADRFEVLGQVVSNDRLLTLKPWQAEAYGLSVGTIANDAELQAFFGADQLIRIEPTWSESLVQLLMSWPVRMAFIAVFAVCALIELALPGTGWFGAGAVVALLVLLGTPMLIGLASWWDVAAVFAGLLLIGVEILVVPGTLIAGMLGAVLLLLGLVGSAVSGDLNSSATQEQLVRGGLIVLIGIGIGWALAWVVVKRLGGAQLGHGVILEATVGEGERDRPVAPNRVGCTGTARTDLRPSGRVDIDGHTLDAVCSGRWIEAGTDVRITRDGLVLEVEPY